MRKTGAGLPYLDKLFSLLLPLVAKLPLSDRIHVDLVLLLLCHDLAIVPHTAAVAAPTAFPLLVLRNNRHLLVV